MGTRGKNKIDGNFEKIKTDNDKEMELLNISGKEKIDI